MHLKHLFGLVALFTAVAAIPEGGYLVPKDLAPGFYVVNFHGDGNSTVEKVDVPEKRDLLSTGSAKFPGHLTKRATYQGTGRYMTQQAEYNSLTVAWRNYFNGGGTLEGGHIWFITTEHLVLAVCVYGTGHLTLPGSRVDDFNGGIDQNLGFWQTAWANFGLYTFWRDYRGYQICGNLNGGYVPK